MPKRLRDRVPVGGTPAGLISWYAPGQKAIALVTTWMALVSGEPPRLRAAWPGRRDPRSLFWPGGDFVLNVPGDRDLQLILKLVGSGRVCFDVEQDLGIPVMSASAVSAPRLVQCPVQLECCRGRVDTEPVEPEVTGMVSHLHCGGEIVDLAGGADLVKLKPFSLPVS